MEQQKRDQQSVSAREQQAETSSRDLGTVGGGNVPGEHMPTVDTASEEKRKQRQGTGADTIQDATQQDSFDVASREGRDPIELETSRSGEPVTRNMPEDVTDPMTARSPKKLSPQERDQQTEEARKQDSK